MKIGIDGSMDVNIAEGYGIMEFKKRELFPNGTFDPDCSVRFFAHYPEYVLEELYGTRNPVGVKRLVRDTWMSANEAWEIYLSKKDSIDSFVGQEGEREFPTEEYGLLHLIDDLNSYGLID